MRRLIHDLISLGYLKSDRIIKAFLEVDRAGFVPEEIKKETENNIPLPIEFGQTISQPLTVAFMLELLDPNKGQNILDVGSGSGWTSALLANIVGVKGKIIAIERIPELCQRGKENAEKFNQGIIYFKCGDGSKGYSKNAPYDRILVSATTSDIPKELLDQLKDGGKMVIPVGGSIFLIKKNKETIIKKEFPGFSFVPLIENKV